MAMTLTYEANLELTNLITFFYIKLLFRSYDPLNFKKSSNNFYETFLEITFVVIDYITNCDTVF